MQKVKEIYLKKVTDIDNKGLRVRFYGHPFGIFHKLKPTNMFILVQNGEKIAVSVGHKSKNLWRDGAWRVSVQSHETCARVAVVFPYTFSYTQIIHENFSYQLCEFLHCTCVVLHHFPKPKQTEKNFVIINYSIW